MRALVVSDTHFGAWTGEDTLRHDHELALLAAHLDDVDEVVFLGDLFDFLFASVRDAVAAAEGLFSLLREKLQGKRFVFLAGNHDHHLVAQQAEQLRDLELVTGERSQRLGEQVDRQLWFRQLLESRLDGVEICVRYPTYTVGGVLCTHGHYLDYHAHRHGSLPNRLLGRALWSIASGGARTPTPSIEDYEAVITMLTELLYTIAQLPHGTAAQQGVYGALQRAERIAQGRRGTRARGQAAGRLGRPAARAARLVGAARQRQRASGGRPALRARPPRRARPSGGGPAAQPWGHGGLRTRPRGAPDRSARAGAGRDRAGRREPRLGARHRQDRLRSHPPAARRRDAADRGARALLEHRLLDL